MQLPKLRKVGTHWFMDTTVNVRGEEMPVTITPTRQEVALWEALLEESHE